MSLCASLLLNALRVKLKENDLTYNELSNKVNVPVSTLKRHFHSHSIGIDKLLEYASVLNTNLEELSQLAREIHNKEEGLDGATNDYIFYEHPYLYDFFYEIRVMERPIPDVAKEYDLTEQSVYVYLRALEMMGILAMKPDGKVNFLTPPYYSFHEGSSLDELFTQKLKEEVFRYDKRPEIGMSRVCLTNEQIEQISESVYEKVQQFHFQNKDSKNDKEMRKNVLLNVTDGHYLKLSDGIKNIEPSILKGMFATVSSEC
ncbi:helix-turn-helix transcriptional regulator [Vibrio sp. Of7-15]|uniref:helix-turn-helix domain-containing protein n=1 Tax=Vibrio sp. Of7-15 TaxID=2724879 RepID=UPI001EF249FF|nr:helix-turn-helix transcriptional regulator [Vibrio sp. Of7-15]MCG7495551.1 helix-turn-helix transcriptional regulator [Vibrio sp. Of7-15]